MKTLSRRDMLKAGLLAPAAVAAAQGAGPLGAAMQPIDALPGLLADYAQPDPAEPGFGRERLLLDFGWRFHFGHADDPRQGLRVWRREARKLPEDRQLSSRRANCI